LLKSKRDVQKKRGQLRRKKKYVGQSKKYDNVPRKTLGKLTRTKVAAWSCKML
jgi:hypothetical protein